MKPYLSIFSGALLLFTANAFIPKPQSDPAVYKIQEVTYLWDLMGENYEVNWDRDQTWLDTGFRCKYAMARKYASLEMIETAFGMPVFLRGPHNGEMNFESNTEFGYYNPEFVDHLHTSIEAALQNPLFKTVAQKVYREHLASMAKTYHRAYTYLQEDPSYLEALQSQYIDLMAQPEGIDGGSFQEEFRHWAEGLEQREGADIYEAFTAPAFWLRRSIDGSSYQYFQLLEMVMRELE